MSQELLHAVDLPGDDVFIMYEYQLKTGDRHRNTEVITVRNSQLIEPRSFLPDVVYLEQLTSALYLDKAPHVDHYLAVMSRLCVQAKSPDATIKFLTTILNDL